MAYKPGRGTLQFNLATQGRRQAGSSFKPFVLTAALEEGFALGSGFSGPPELTIQDPLCSTNGELWNVHNYADESEGYMSLRQALAHSVNTVFAQLVDEVGPDKVVKLAHSMGISSKLQPVCSITLGSQSVSPLEMTDAYATFASRGIYHAPQPIASVRAPGGKTVYKFHPEGRRVVPQNIADQAVEALQGVVQYGTGRRGEHRPARSPGRPARRRARRTPGSAASRRSS